MANESNRARNVNVGRYAWILAAAWTVIVGVSLGWNISRAQDGVEDAASTQANAVFDKDVIFRRWNASHGGVYVPVTEETPPNPYLSHLPERDIATPSGQLLTLMNPAYMTRQVHELEQEETGVRGHITSLNPIRPENAPDPWESKALEAFEQGETEVSSIENIAGEVYLRLMRPFITEQGCLKCHAVQGYKLGDIRGGISASVPMAPLLGIARAQVTSMSIGHTALWLTGLVVLGLGSRRLQQRVRERDRAEAGLKLAKEKAEGALAELEKAHEQLMQSDKMASIGQLAAGVAHEINNPIGFIASNLNSASRYVADIKGVLVAHDELLCECRNAGGVSTEKANWVDRVRKEADIDYVMSDLVDLIAESTDGAKRVRQIVADLKDFSHVESPDVAVEDVHTILDKTLSVACNELKYKTEVVRDYGDIPTLTCYGGKLGQVFLNLLVNAAQAIEERGTITIRTGHEGERIWVEIEDTGCGIPPESMDCIFDPFFTTKGVGQGTGLGLHVVHKIIHAHAGRITVRSQVGKGTAFRIELPVTGPPAAKESELESVT